jgi:hypothetical protein
MTNFGKRVSHVTLAGPDPTLDISADQFARLESIYGVSLDSDARAELIAIANQFLHWRIRELISEPFKDVVTRFEKMKAPVTAFQSFAQQLTDGSGAGVQLRGVMRIPLFDRASIPSSRPCGLCGAARAGGVKAGRRPPPEAARKRP